MAWYRQATKHYLKQYWQNGMIPCSVIGGQWVKHIFLTDHRTIGSPLLVAIDRKCLVKYTQRAKFMGPTWGQHGSCQPQMGPMLGHVLCSSECIHHVQLTSSYHYCWSWLSTKQGISHYLSQQRLISFIQVYTIPGQYCSNTATCVSDRSVKTFFNPTIIGRLETHLATGEFCIYLVFI